MANNNVENYEKYFEEDLKAIEEELEKSKGYSAIIDREIEDLSKPILNGKGSTRYLIDILEKAVSLQTQRQGLRRDKVAIKKAILDYAMKNNENNSDESLLIEKIDALLKKDREDLLVESESVNNSSPDLDLEIDRILNNQDSNN